MKTQKTSNRGMEPYCKVLQSTHKPQQLIWLAAHQDYSSEPVHLDNVPARDESYYGDRIIQMLLAGGKGHFGCLEHPQITINCCYFPHSTVMQARTHRVGISFDVQSFRYTSSGIMSITDVDSVEQYFYFRPVGQYTDRQGHKYEYTEEELYADKWLTYCSVRKFQQKMEKGVSEEHARDCLTSNYRQHFVVSFNARSLFHFLDLRAKADAQLEIQQLCDSLLDISKEWMPELTFWYQEHRWKKAKLAP